MHLPGGKEEDARNKHDMPRSDIRHVRGNVLVCTQDPMVELALNHRVLSQNPP